MYGKIRINVTEVDDEASVVEVHTDIHDGSAEEVINVVHGLSNAFHLLDTPEYAGALALSILTNKQAYQLADELSPERLVIIGKALHETTNEVVDEIARRNKERKSASLLKRWLDKMFED